MIHLQARNDECIANVAPAEAETSKKYVTPAKAEVSKKYVTPAKAEVSKKYVTPAKAEVSKIPICTGMRVKKWIPASEIMRKTVIQSQRRRIYCQS